MLIAFLTGAFGFVIYAWFDRSIGYAIAMVGIVLMAVAIGFNIAIARSETRKQRPAASVR